MFEVDMGINRRQEKKKFTPSLEILYYMRSDGSMAALKPEVRLRTRSGLLGRQ